MLASNAELQVKERKSKIYTNIKTFCFYSQMFLFPAAYKLNEDPKVAKNKGCTWINKNRIKQMDQQNKTKITRRLTIEWS